MNDDQLKQRQLAVRERRQLLDLTYSRNGRAPAQAGLVALSRACSSRRHDTSGVRNGLDAMSTRQPSWAGNLSGTRTTRKPLKN